MGEALKGFLSLAELPEGLDRGPWEAMLAIACNAFVDSTIPDWLTLSCLVLILKASEPGKHRGIRLLEASFVEGDFRDHQP